MTSGKKLSTLLENLVEYTLTLVLLKCRRLFGHEFWDASLEKCMHAPTQGTPFRGTSYLALAFPNPIEYYCSVCVTQDPTAVRIAGLDEPAILGHLHRTASARVKERIVLTGLPRKGIHIICCDRLLSYTGCLRCMGQVSSTHNSGSTIHAERGGCTNSGVPSF